MAPLSRAELHRMRGELVELRPGPWTPAMTLRMEGREHEWVCNMRRVVPDMVEQLLSLMRSNQRLARELAEALSAGAPA